MARNRKALQEKESSPTGMPARKLADARRVFNVLLLSWKNCLLYPEGHKASAKALANIISAFEDFFSIYSALRLTIKKDTVLYGPEILQELSSPAQAEDLVSLLYRDGIQWIEFNQGLTAEELARFFQIVSRNKQLTAETEGDIVTALIDAELECIRFKAVDVFWQDFPLLDFSQLDTSPPAAREAAYTIETEGALHYEGPRRHDDAAQSIADPSVDDALWEVSAAEHEKLQQMVLDEENWDNTEDVFDVLLVILRSQTVRENFAAVLDFIREEVTVSIEQGEFRLLLKLFQSLHRLLYRDASADPTWLRPLIHRFFQDLSTPAIFDTVTAKLLKLHDPDTEAVKLLRQVLLYFSPEVILSLGQVVTRSRSPAVQQMVIEVIEFLCHRDIAPLEKILEQPDNELAERLLTILGRLRAEGANRIFFKMLDHPSEKVRAQAARMLIAGNPQSVQKLFPLIDDPSVEIRTEILGAMAKQRSVVLEGMLLKYMRGDFLDKTDDHILACYETLGSCGTDTAIPYLRHILLDRGWNRFTGYGRPVHRQGAATALALLDTWKAKDVLLAASKSRFQAVRQAFHRAMARSEQLRGHGHG